MFSTIRIFDNRLFKQRQESFRPEKTDLTELGRRATDSFVEVQKKLVDVVGRQMIANVKTAGRTLDILSPLPLVPLSEGTREGVERFVQAQKAVLQTSQATAPSPWPGHVEGRGESGALTTKSPLVSKRCAAGASQGPATKRPAPLLGQLIGIAPRLPLRQFPTFSSCTRRPLSSTPHIVLLFL